MHINSYIGSVHITANSHGYNKGWTFERTGNLIIPDNGIIKYSNNTQYGNGSGTSYNQSLNTDSSVVFANVIATNAFEGVNANVTLSTNTQNWIFDDTGRFTVAGDMIPTSNNIQNIGSPTNQWKSLYVSNGSIYIDSVKLSSSGANVVVGSGNTSITIGAKGITLPANATINDNLGKSVLSTSISSRNILNINVDGGISAAIFSLMDTVYDGGGTSTLYGEYSPSLDGNDAFTDFSQITSLDGGGCSAF
jgi:hypothetical protein